MDDTPLPALPAEGNGSVGGLRQGEVCCLGQGVQFTNHTVAGSIAGSGEQINIGALYAFSVHMLAQPQPPGDQLLVGARSLLQQVWKVEFAFLSGCHHLVKVGDFDDVDDESLVDGQLSAAFRLLGRQ